MAPGAKVYAAGASGSLGSALVRCLRAPGFENLVTRAHAEFDLGDAGAVHGFFAREWPEQVFLAAAKDGGSWSTPRIPRTSSARTYRSRPMSSTRSIAPA